LQRTADLLKMRLEVDFWQEIQKLVSPNHASLRLRLTVFRSGDGLYQPTTSQADFLIQAQPLAQSQYSYLPSMQKSVFFDAYPISGGTEWSNLKTIGGSMPYILAALHKEEQNADEVFLLNQWGRVVEALSANVFWIEDEQIYTPPLSEGAIAGVMRAFLLENSRNWTTPIREKVCTLADFSSASAVFTTNSIAGIRTNQPQHRLVEHCRQVIETHLNPHYCP
jgi:branched-chain amino acid aminotransferase